MRGQADEQLDWFHLFQVEDRIRQDHPLRDVKRRVDGILKGMSPQFDKAYSAVGRPSVPPERLLKALLLMTLDSIRSERQLCERIDTDLLFRWFLDMKPSEQAFDATTFSHNRKRLDEHRLTRVFFDAVLAEALTRGLCSEHFSVDGTLIESYASAKSFQPIEPSATPAASEPTEPTEPTEPGSAGEAGTAKEGSPAGPRADANGFQPRNVEVDFHGQKRTNATHRSRTDPEAKLYRKGHGRESKLAHLGHVLNENRHGLIVGVTVTEANGTAERQAALDLLDEARRTHRVNPKTLGTDKGFDSGAFYRELEGRGIEPHGAMIDQRLRDPGEVKPPERPNAEAWQRLKGRQQGEGYWLSQMSRKKVEEGFGWLKEIGRLGRSRVVGRWKLKPLLEIGAAAFNLVRRRKLAPGA